MEERRRPKRVANLIKDHLSRILIQELQPSFPGLLTITRIEMSPDLRAAHVFFSILGDAETSAVLHLLEQKTGYMRRYLASAVNLKYNPQLFFHADPSVEYEEKIDRLIAGLRTKKKDE